MLGMEDTLWVKLLVKIGLAAVFFVLCFLWYWFKFVGGSRKIVKAIELGDVDALRALVEKHRALLVEDDYEVLTTYLTLAVTANQPECLKVLLELGEAAHLQQRTLEEDDDALLQLCIEHGSPDMLRIMLAAGMNPVAEPESPWMHCFVHGSVEHARVLREFNGDKLTPEQLVGLGGESPLHAVVYGWYYNPKESADLLRYLLHEYGANPNVMTTAGNTPLDLACDETHVGYEGNDELRRMLIEAGGKRGRSIRVPEPAYTGRVFVKGELPDVAVIAATMPENLTISTHCEPWNPTVLRDCLKDMPIKDEVAERILSHTSYVQVAVQGKAGEDPVSVAECVLTVLRMFESAPGVVGVQFQSFIGSGLHGAPGDLIPYNLVSVELGRTDDGAYLLATNGMPDFGLPEVELEMPAPLYEGLKISPFAPLGDVLVQLMRGTSAIEPGHSMTLLGRFYTSIEWGNLLTTRAAGFRCVMTTEPTPADLLSPKM